MSQRIRPAATSGLAATASDPLGGRRPGQVGGVGHRRQVDADRAGAHRPDRERDRQQHALVVLPAEPAQRKRDMDVGAGQHAGRVEVGKQPGRTEGESSVGGVDGLEEVSHVHFPSRRSDRAVTRATGGCHEKTPHGRPSTLGVSGPHMPRR